MVTSPKPETIAAMAHSVATHLTTGTAKKSHGGWKYYQDERIHISLDTYVPNITVKIMVNGQWQDVYSAGYHNHSRPNRYNPGNWTRYLHDLAERAAQAGTVKEREQQERDRAEQARRFGAIDDAAAFPATHQA